MDLTNKETIINLLTESGAEPKKFFGQNFLINNDVLQQMVETAEITPEDIVIEVGPGLGTATKELAKRAKTVYAFEIDEQKLPILERTLKEFNNVVIINQDFLEVNLPEFFQSANIKRYKFVSSLPYNISKKILKILLELENKPELISVLIQKEVADKYIGEKNDRTFLSNYLELFGTGGIVDVVIPESFYPAPKVTSAILKIKVNSGAEVNREFVKFLKSGFLNPRKKLLNNLSGTLKLNTDDLRTIFKELKLNENIRAQNLSLEEWRQLFQQIIK